MSIINTRNPDHSELSIDNTLAKRLRWDGEADPLKSSSTTDDGSPVARKPTDLRKLSQWIQVQRQVAELKKRER